MGTHDSTEQAPDKRPLDDVETEICTLAGQIAAATARFLTLIADFDTRRGWASWQLHSCAQWLSWKAGVSLHTAREYVRVAGALTELPHIAAAFAAGTLSYSKVRALTRVATAETEESLLRIALQSPAAHLDRLCRGLATQTRTPAEDADRCTGRWFYDDDGTLVVTARLLPDDGARFLAALTRAEYERTRTTDAEPDLTAPPPPNPVPALIAMADTVRTVAADSPVIAPGADVLVHIGTADTPEVAPHAHLDDGPGLDTPTLAGLLCSATLCDWSNRSPRADHRMGSLPVSTHPCAGPHPGPTGPVLRSPRLRAHPIPPRTSRAVLVPRRHNRPRQPDPALRRASPSLARRVFHHHRPR